MSYYSLHFCVSESPVKLMPPLCTNTQVFTMHAQKCPCRHVICYNGLAVWRQRFGLGRVAGVVLQALGFGTTLPAISYSFHWLLQMKTKHWMLKELLLCLSCLHRMFVTYLFLFPSFHLEKAPGCHFEGCQFNCSVTHEGPKCYCNPGYEVGPDGKICKG